jgi:hypothetical protein
VKLKDAPDIPELIMKRLPYLEDDDKKAADEETSMLERVQSKFVV